jgi:hypothetical protein
MPSNKIITIIKTCVPFFATKARRHKENTDKTTAYGRFLNDSTGYEDY